MGRLIGRNVDGQTIEVDHDDEVIAVAGVPIVRYIRPYERLGAIPPWGFVRYGNRLIGESEDCRLLCPHCTRWRTLAELHDIDNGCPIGVMPRPGALVPMPGNGLPVVDVTRGMLR